jgi:hypothetical protein
MVEPGPQPVESGPPAVLTSVVRNVTPVAVTAVTYALARSNIHLLDNAIAETIINTLLSAIVGLAWTAVFRWLESHKSSWWGRAFLIASAPAYSSTTSTARPAVPPTSGAAAPQPEPRG